MDKSARDKKPRFSEEMIQDCLEVLDRGESEDLFEIIPRLGVLRDPRFDEYLVAFLAHEDSKRREFAAYAMGAIGRRSYLEPLKRAFREAEPMRGSGAEELQTAILEAIGSLGDDTAAAFFLPILETPCENIRSQRTLRRRIVEALGAIAQQGGERSLDALVATTRHDEADLRAQALSEISVAYWHRPNDISDAMLQRIYDCKNDSNSEVAESALAALESLADVGCRGAERFFGPREN